MDAYWSNPTDKLLSEFETRREGLSQSEAFARQDQYGPNSLRQHKRATAIGSFFSQFRSPLILILLFATAISALTKDFIDAIIILIDPHIAFHHPHFAHGIIVNNLR